MELPLTILKYRLYRERESAWKHRQRFAQMGISNYLLTPDALTLGVKSSTNGEGNTVESMVETLLMGPYMQQARKLGI